MRWLFGLVAVRTSDSRYYKRLNNNTLVYHLGSLWLAFGCRLCIIWISYGHHLANNYGMHVITMLGWPPREEARSVTKSIHHVSKELPGSACLKPKMRTSGLCGLLRAALGHRGPSVLHLSGLNSVSGFSACAGYFVG